MSSFDYSSEFKCHKCGGNLIVHVVKMSGPKVIVKVRCPKHGEKALKLQSSELNQYLPYLQEGTFRCFKCGSEAKIDHKKFSGHFVLVRMFCPTHRNKLPFQKIWNSIYDAIEKHQEMGPPKPTQEMPVEPAQTEPTPLDIPTIPSSSREILKMELKKVKKTQIIKCTSDWDLVNIKAVINAFCKNFTAFGTLPLIESENNVLKGSIASAGGTNPPLEGTFTINESEKSPYVQIDYYLTEFGKKQAQQYWNGVFKGLKSVFAKSLSSYEKQSEESKPKKPLKPVDIELIKPQQEETQPTSTESEPTVSTPSIDIPKSEPIIGKNTKIIYCKPDWQLKVIKDIIIGFCQNFQPKIGRIKTIKEVEPYVFDLTSHTKKTKGLGKLYEYKGTVKIGVSPARGTYITIDYDEGSVLKHGLLFQSFIESFWGAMYLGLKTVFEKSFQEYVDM